MFAVSMEGEVGLPLPPAVLDEEEEDEAEGWSILTTGGGEGPELTPAESSFLTCPRPPRVFVIVKVEVAGLFSRLGFVEVGLVIMDGFGKLPLLRCSCVFAGARRVPVFCGG